MAVFLGLWVLLSSFRERNPSVLLAYIPTPCRAGLFVEWRNSQRCLLVLVSRQPADRPGLKPDNQRKAHFSKSMCIRCLNHWPQMHNTYCPLCYIQGIVEDGKHKAFGPCLEMLTMDSMENKQTNKPVNSVERVLQCPLGFSPIMVATVVLIFLLPVKVPSVLMPTGEGTT